MTTESRVKTPLLRVSRPVSACSRCRMSKIRCDGKLPACSACERSGRSGQCSNANDEFAKGKERCYVSSLEARVEKLEKQLSLASGRKSPVPALDFLPNQPAIPPKLHIDGHDQRNQSKEASDVNDLVSDFGFLSVNATARDFHGFTKEMSFARLVLSSATMERMPGCTNDTLPPRNAATPLIQHYLENIFVLYPFLYEIKVFSSLDAVYQDGGRYATPMDDWIIRLVLANAFASLSRRRGDTQYRNAVRHAAFALKQAELVVQPGSVQGIQAILLLAQYAMLDPHHFNSWYLIGAAARAMVDLGLHQDSHFNPLAKSPNVSLRRRVYHSVYALDRSVSMVYLRAFSFTDDSTNVAPLDNYPPPSSTPITPEKPLFFHQIDAAVHLTRLRRLQSCSYQELYQSSPQVLEQPWPVISKALKSLHMWAFQMPNTIKEPIRRLIHSDLLYSNILVLSPPGLRGPLPEHGKALIFDCASEFAELVSQNNENLAEFAFWTFHDLQRAAYVSSRFLDILEEDPNPLFNGVAPQNLQEAEPVTALPIIRSERAKQMANRAISCLDSLDKALESFGTRFGDLGPWEIHAARRSQILPKLREHYTCRTSYDDGMSQAS